MPNWPVLGLTILAISGVGSAQAANVARFASGDGHLAAKVGDSGWQGMRLGDELPTSSNLRTSPAGNVRIDIPNGLVSMGNDADIDLNVTTRTISLFGGRIRIQNLAPDGEGEWAVITGTTEFLCPSGSDVEFSYLDTYCANVLSGAIRVRQTNLETDAQFLVAPLEWAKNSQGIAKSSVPTDELWASTIRLRTEPRIEQGLGQLVARDGQSGSQVRLEIARYHVNIDLQPPTALVQIDQSFFNPYGRQDEGTFVFNLPDGASISRFAMFVSPDNLIEGELAERTATFQIDASDVNQRRDPAILEQIGSNLFRIRIFPIFARDTKRILLDYTIPLVHDQGRYHFELPLMSDLKPIWDFGITGVVHPPFALRSLSSQTHRNLSVREDKDGSVRFQFQARDVQPPPKFLMDFHATTDRQPTLRNFESESGEKYFVVTLPESINPASRTPPDPTDVLVLVDTSENTEDLNRARIVARTLVSNLRPQDRWQLGCVDVGYRPITTDWMTPRSPEVRSVFRQLDETFLLGSAQLDTAIREVLPLMAESTNNRRRVIVYLGDGDRSTSSDGSCWLDESFFVNSSKPLEFHAVKLGRVKSAGQWLHEGVSRTKGRVFDFDRSTAVVRDLFEWSLAGIPRAAPIASCNIDGVPDTDLFYDQTWPRGRDLFIYGRGKATKSLSIKLKTADAAERKYEIPVDAQRHADDFITGRDWARRRLDSLLEKTTPDDEAGIASIVRICQEWGLMSPYTTYMIVDSEQDYVRWNVLRKVRRRYWKPLDVADLLLVHENLKQSTALRAAQNQRLTPSAQHVDPVISKSDLDRFSDRLAAAKHELSKRNPTAAATHLLTVRIDPTHIHWRDYEELRAETRKAMNREKTVNGLKFWGSLVDRRADTQIPAIAPLILEYSHGSANTEYLERHPHAINLLKPIPELKPDELTLTEMANQIERSTGIPILFDRKSMNDEGISEDQQVLANPIPGAPLKTFLNLTLAQFALKLVPERHLWRITTETVANESMVTHVYPVVDLLRPDVLPLPSRLANPNLDFANAQRKANELRLQRPITAQFDKIPIGDAIESVFEKIGGAKFWIDAKGMSEQGVSVDTQVSMSANQLPAEIVLKEILSPLALEYVIRDGVFLVTTQTVADEILETRVYSAAGIVDFGISDLEHQLHRDRLNTTNPADVNVMGGAMPVRMHVGGGIGDGTTGWNGNVRVLVAGAGGLPSNADAVNVSVGELALRKIDESESKTVDSMISKAEPTLNWKLSPHQAKRSMQQQLSAHLIQQSTSGKWIDTDGGGGQIDFHAPSSSIVIRNTQRVHAEIKELLAKLRRQPQTNQLGITNASKRRQIDTRRKSDYLSLMRTIQQFTSGPWEEIEGNGGRQSPHLPTNSLAIRQSDEVHEEIEQLLVQLRRARFIAESLPWQTSLEGIDDLVTSLDRPTITDLPRNSLEQKNVEANTAQSLRLLAVRKSQVSMNQRWQAVSMENRRQREIAIRRQGSRLEIVLPDRTMRVDGPRAAVAYPGLTLVEIDAWGDSTTQLIDSIIPWLPHRSNEELARLFDVTVESDDAETVTLNLAFPDCEDTCLKATFSKRTGAPVAWQSVVMDETQFELKFTDKNVIAVDSSGTVLEKWELIADDPVAVVPGLADGWNEFIVLNMSASDAPLAAARDALRRGDNSAAIKAFGNLLAERPNQPLLNFLYAWSIGVQGEIDGTLARLQREALTRLIDAGPRDLLRMVTATNFPSIGNDRLRKLFLSIPDARRTEDLWERLSEIAVDQNRHDLALVEIDRAIAITKDVSTRTRREVTRIELLLRNSKPKEAEAAARTLANRDISPAYLLELGGLFGQADVPEICRYFFEKYRGTTNLNSEELSQLAYRQATSFKSGEIRWRAILAADAERPSTQVPLFDSVLLEANTSKDAEILGKLAGELQPGLIQTRLLLRQAELTDNKQLAAGIVLTLFEEKRLPEHQFHWGISVLEQDQRSKEIIEILERRLRKSRIRGSELLNHLATAYTRLGRKADALRANSSIRARWQVGIPPL